MNVYFRDAALLHRHSFRTAGLGRFTPLGPRSKPNFVRLNSAFWLSSLTAASKNTKGAHLDPLATSQPLRYSHLRLNCQTTAGEPLQSITNSYLCKNNGGSTPRPAATDLLTCQFNHTGNQPGVVGRALGHLLLRGSLLPQGTAARGGQ